MLNRSRFVGEPEMLLELHGAKLASLLGKTLDSSWLAWDLDDDSPFMDEAVVLRIGADQLEIVCWKLSEIALTWNCIGLNKRPAWVATWGPEMKLSWRKNSNSILNGAIGQVITDIRVIEYLHRTEVIEDRTDLSNVGHKESAWLLHGLQFVYETGSFSVFNALDENGIDDTAYGDEAFRTTSVAA